MTQLFNEYYDRFNNGLRGVKLIKDLTPEKQAELINYWGENYFSENHFKFLKKLIEAGIQLSQEQLLFLLKHHPIDQDQSGGTEISLALVNMIEDQTAAYKLMEAQIPSYFAHYHYHLKQKDVDHIIKWLNGERSKKIDSSIKTVARVLKKHTFFWNNFPRKFFNQNPLEMEAPSYHKLVKLGILIDRSFTLTYLRNHISYEKITELYGVTQHQWGQYLADNYNNYLAKDTDQLLKAALQQNQEALLPGIVAGDSDGVNEIIPEIIQIDPDLGFKLLKLLTESARKLGNRALREVIVEHLKTYPEAIVIARDLLMHPKKNSRLTGVLLLIQYQNPDDIPLLKRVFSEEQEAKIIKVLKRHLEKIEA